MSVDECVPTTMAFFVSESSLPQQRFIPFMGSILPVDITCNADIVDDKVLGRMRRAWQQYFLEGGGDMAAYQAGTAAECVECRTERHQRQRVLADPTQIPDEFRKAPFDDAVAIYGYNRPRFFFHVYSRT